MRHVKLFKWDPNQPLDDRINEWVEQTGFFIESVSFSHNADCLVVYQKPHAALPADLSDIDFAEERRRLFEEEEDAQKQSKKLKPLPLKEGATSPTWDSTMRDGDGRRKAFVMAGVFPVPEGFRMHPEDREVAPPVLLAHGTDLSQYKDLFGNIGEHNERSKTSASDSS